uniref:Uncharacterized protein n=1 Tax=Arundo donax TaxID=35708 RepID=A0A0A9FSS9_ARUDO
MINRTEFHCSNSFHLNNAPNNQNKVIADLKLPARPCTHKSGGKYRSMFHSLGFPAKIAKILMQLRDEPNLIWKIRN